MVEMKELLLGLTLLIALLAPLAAGADNATVYQNQTINVAPNPTPLIVPENKPDVIVQEKKEIVVVPTPEKKTEVVVPTPVKKTEVNIPGFESIFTIIGIGILVAMRSFREKFR